MRTDDLASQEINCKKVIEMELSSEKEAMSSVNFAVNEIVLDGILGEFLSSVMVQVILGYFFDDFLKVFLH